MKKKTPILLSALIVCLAFVFVANFTGVSAIEEGSETNVTTTKATTVNIETTTKLTWPWQKTSTSSTTVNISSVISSIGDELTGTKTTTSNASETNSESGSETEKPGTTKPKTTTTRKVTTTVKKMTITVVMNTTVPGGTMDPLSAYYSRLSETDEYGEPVSDAETTKENGQDENESNIAVTIIIAVAAMLIAISLLTGLFSMRNKRLAQKEAALKADEDDDAFSGDVIISKKTMKPQFTQTVVDDEDDLIADEAQEDIQQEAQTEQAQAEQAQAEAVQTDKVYEQTDAVGEANPKAETAEGGKTDEATPATDGEKKDIKYEDIFSGRDDI